MTEPAYMLQQLTLLVVDDQDPMRKSIKRLGQSMGFGEVIECSDGEIAVHTIEEKPIDIVITDLYMKKVSGIDVLQHIRNQDMGCDIPVIIVTGESGHDDIVKAADLGAKDYLLKPFQSSDLEKKITRALDSYFAPSEFLDNLRRGERLYIRGEIDRARHFFEIATKKDPSSARAAHGLALSWVKLGFDDMAIALLEKCNALNPSYHRAYGTLADIFLRKGMTDQGLATMLKELKINPKQPTRQVQLGHLLLKHGKPDEAVGHYRVALKEDPKRMAALMGMGQAMAQIGNIEKALYYFHRLRRYYPNSTKALEAGVRACMSVNDWHKAEMFLKEEKATHPKHLDAHFLLATLYFKQSRNEDALELANDILAKNPDVIEGLQIKSTALINLQARDELLPVLVKLGDKAPSGIVLSQIARIHIQNNKDEEGLSYIHQAMAIPDGAFEPFILLAEILKSNRSWFQSVLMYRRALALGAPRETCLKDIEECMKQSQLRRRRLGFAPIAS